MSGETARKENISKVVLDLPQLSVQISPEVVSEALKKISGIQAVEVDFIARKIGIEFDSGVISFESVRENLTRLSTGEGV